MAKAKPKTETKEKRLTVQSIVERFMGDVEMTAAKIREAVLAEIPKAKTSVRSVSSTLSTLREKLGVEAVPQRRAGPGGRGGYGLIEWLTERLQSPGANKAVAEEAGSHFGRTVSYKTVASYRSKLKRRGVPVVPAK